jgi:hypothetical protein
MATNSFARFGIDHLSSSSLNLWQSSPGIWAYRYIGRVRDGGNAAMWRGSAVENGLAALLRGGTAEQSALVAHTSFDLNCGGEITDEIEAERELITPMLKQCHLWQPPSALNAAQLRIEHWFDDIPVPVIGFLDFAFDGIDVDLKTTKACPSVPRPDHVRQVSLYRASRGRNGGLLYVTNKRHAYYEVDDDMAERALSDMEVSARSLQQFLARMDSREDVLRSLPIDFDHYAAPKTRVPLAQVLLAG